jgi:hypothetical protein
MMGEEAHEPNPVRESQASCFGFERGALRPIAHQD